MRAIEVSTIAPATLATALSPLTDQEIRERAAVLRDAGQLGARHATPPPRGELAAEAVELPPCAPLPREEIELRAVEASETIPPAYPRTRVVSEATLLSLRLRQYSRDLDLLASSAPSYEPGTLRRKLNAIRTQLAMVIGGVMVLLATACGGVAEPAPVPYEPPAPETGDQALDGAATYRIPALACVAVFGAPGTFAVAVGPATELTTIEGDCVRFEAHAETDGATAENWDLVVRGDVVIREGSYGGCSCTPAK